MARTHARIYTNFWNDETVKALPFADAKLLYLYLTTEANLSRCGVMAWHSRRIMRKLGPDFTLDRLTVAAQALVAAHMIVIDQEEHEVLVRSLVRHDGILDRTSIATTMMNDLKEVASTVIYRQIIAELVRYRRDEPELSGWKARGMDELLAQAGPVEMELAEQTPTFPPNTLEASREPLPPLAPLTGAINVVDMDLNSTRDLSAVMEQLKTYAPEVETRLYPDSGGVVPRSGAQTSENVPRSTPSSDTRSSTSTSTSTSTSAGGAEVAPSSRQRSAPPKEPRASRIPENFVLTDAMRAWAQDKAPLVNVDERTEIFVRYWQSESGPKTRKLDWLKTWQNWIVRDQHDAEDRARRAGGVARPGVNPATSTAASAGVRYGAARKSSDWMGD
jgi:hypothetical protein